MAARVSASIIFRLRGMYRMEKQGEKTRIVQTVIGKVIVDDIGVYAAQSAFFILMSTIPFLILLLQLLQFLPYGRQDVYTFFEVLMPEYLLPLLTSILDELYSIPVNLFWITTFLAIWGSSKAMHTICYGLDCISGIKKKRSWFQIRGWALLYTIVFALLIIFILVSTIFWKSIITPVEEAFSSSVLSGLFSHGAKMVFDFVIMTLFFIIMFRVFPSRKMSTVHNLPGALFTSLGWLIFSEFFYMYVNMVASGSMYGSLATIVFLMVWLYFCMFILFIGGEINEVLRRERRRQHRMEFQSRARKMDQLAKDQAEKELSMDPDMLDARPTRRIE